MDTIFIVAAAALFLIAIERWLPATALPQRSGWYWRMAALNGAQILVSYTGASTWDLWLSDARPWVNPLHPAAAALLGYVVLTFVYYWWHRARHEVPFLWRYLHQVHHSPARLEVLTSFYKHPVEILLNGLLSSTLLYLLLGLDPVTATIVVAITGVAELLYHANLKTPYWLGFVFQRPESHRVHHESAGIARITRTYRYGTGCSARSTTRGIRLSSAASPPNAKRRLVPYYWESNHE